MMPAGGSALRLLACLLTAFTQVPVAAADNPPSSRGFVVYETAVVKAGPDAVWAALIQPSRWWNREHSWSGDSTNLTLDPHAGGCFCEALPDGGSAEHMHIVQSVPGSLLRMKGALGPLQSEGLEGVLTIEMRPGEGATTISWTYVVGGYSRLPLDSIAPAVDSVLGEQARRLAALIEFGDPAHPTQG
jgi:hypothetical protein